VDAFDRTTGESVTEHIFVVVRNGDHPYEVGIRGVQSAGLVPDSPPGEMAILVENDMLCTSRQIHQEVSVDFGDDDQITSPDGRLLKAGDTRRIIKPGASKSPALMQHACVYPNQVQNVGVPIDDANASCGLIEIGLEEINSRVWGWRRSYANTELVAPTPASGSFQSPE
jgi:hypothetical protein